MNRVKAFSSVIVGLAVFSVESTFAAHHEEAAASPWKYSLSIESETRDLNGFLADSKKFADSGVLAKRGASMTVYQINAGGHSGANVMTEFYYPNADAMPSPDVMVASQAHIDTFGTNPRDDDNVRATFYQNIHFVAPGEPSQYRVYIGYSVKATNSDYVSQIKEIMSDFATGNEAYGINEVIAGGLNGETHLVWWGYDSQASLMEDLERTRARYDEVVARLTASREILRTAVVTSILNSATPE